MANYHLSIKIFSRSKGASAVAKAAYRAAECITNEHDGETHNYTRKRGVVYKEIILPDHAPEEYANRTVLWNAVEKAEVPKNAQLAREVEISLPIELNREQNISLAREFVKRTFVEQGMCADLCVHDTDGTNPHAHIMLTMRPLEPDGSWGAKCHKINGRKINTVDWNDLTKAEDWRAAWSDAVNAALEREGEAARVDHRSYARQGVEQIPTVHLGVAATQMEKRGIRTDLGDKNREIAVTNSQIRQLRGRIRKLKDWIYAQPLQNAPTMRDMVMGVNAGIGLKSQWQKIATLQEAAKVLIFVQRNGINTPEQLADKIVELHKAQYNLGNKVKADERRLTTLKQHLAQIDIRKKHMAVYKKYQQLDPKKRNAYAEKHADEIAAYKSAAKYLKDHLNGHDKIPAKEWGAEYNSLLAERYANLDRYYKLKDDVQNVEVLRRSAERIMCEVAVERKSKTHELGH